MSIFLNDVSRQFGDQVALDGISASIEDGSMVTVLGANGAGKSTLLRLIAGWLPTSRGRVEVEGSRMGPNQVSTRRHVLLLDEPRQHDGSVIDSIAQVVSEFDVQQPGVEDEVAQWMQDFGLVGI